MQSAARTYFQTQVTTTTQGDLLIMLFDGAIKFLIQAKEKIAEKNFAQKGILISRALDILSELQGSLNAQKGGDLADRLQKLYFFCSARLLMANLKMDVSKIDEVLNILHGLRDAFHEANGKVTSKAVPTTANTRSPIMFSSAAGAAGNMTQFSSEASMLLPPVSPSAGQAVATTASEAVSPVVSLQEQAPHAQACVSLQAQVSTPHTQAPGVVPQPEASSSANAESSENNQAPRQFVEVVSPAIAPVRRAVAAYTANRPAK